MAAAPKVEVTVPAGAKPGQTVTVTAANGESVTMVVPEGAKAGEALQVASPQGVANFMRERAIRASHQRDRFPVRSREGPGGGVPGPPKAQGFLTGQPNGA